MPTPASAFAAVAAVLADIDPADRASVDRFFDEGIRRFDPRAQALIADFLVGLTDEPRTDELHALQSMVARPAAALPSLDAPGHRARRGGPRPANTASTTARATDAHIGARITQRRAALGITEAQLAATLGLTARDIRQFEAGAAGLSAALLHAVARALDLPAGFFFQGLPGAPGITRPPPRTGLAEAAGGFSTHDPGPARRVSEPQAERPEPPPDPEHAVLLATYDAISTPANRRRALALISGMAAAGP